MNTFLHHVSLAAPLFVLVFVGYALVLWGHWPRSVSEALTRFVFSIALPALLFHLMSDLSRLPLVDARLLIAFFGSCLIVFAIARDGGGSVGHGVADGRAFVAGGTGLGLGGV